MHGTICRPFHQIRRRRPGLALRGVPARNRCRCTRRGGSDVAGEAEVLRGSRDSTLVTSRRSHRREAGRLSLLSGFCAASSRPICPLFCRKPGRARQAYADSQSRCYSIRSGLIIAVAASASAQIGARPWIIPALTNVAQSSVNRTMTNRESSHPKVTSSAPTIRSLPYHETVGLTRTGFRKDCLSPFG